MTVTVASTVLVDEHRAASEIVRCVEACLRQKRPVYIEVPHDIVESLRPSGAGRGASGNQRAQSHRRRDRA